MSQAAAQYRLWPQSGYGPVGELESPSPCHGEDRGFKSRQVRVKKNMKIRKPSWATGGPGSPWEKKPAGETIDDQWLRWVELELELEHEDMTGEL